MYQFSAFCFGLSTALQVFSRVMAPVSAILHSWGIRMRRYLDDWLVQSSSRESLLHDLRIVLDLCHDLGIVLNPEKSHLEPSQVLQYLGVMIDTRSFRASPSPDRVARLQSSAGEFLSCADPPASTWLSLLVMLSSLSHLVPGGRLRVRSLQLCLHRSWDRGDQSVRIPWSPDCLRDLRWWLHLPCLLFGVSAASLSRSGLLVRRLRRGLGSSLRFTHRFRPLESGSKRSLYKRQGASSHPRGSPPLPVFSGGRNVSVFCDNSTAVSYLRKEGGTRSPFLNSLTQEILRWAESLSIRLLPQFIPGSLNVLADSLSPSPASTYRVVPSSGGFSVFKSSVAGPIRLICNISQSPMFSLFLSLPGSDGCGHRRLPPELELSSGLRISSVVSHSTSASEAPDVSGDGAHLSGSVLASARMVSRPSSPVAGPSGCSASSSRPPAPASVSLPLPGSPQATASCLETLRRFTRAAGFSSSVAFQASLSRRPSSCKAYQLKWQVYR